LETAYRYKDADRQLNVIFFSDGMTQNDERRELIDLISARPSGTRVFCIGVGNEVNRPLLTEMAEDAGGLAAFISRGDNFSRQARAFRRKLSRPAASNVKIEFPDGDVYDIEPHKLANLYHGTPIKLYARFKNAGSTTVHLTADVAGRLLERTVSIDLGASPGENPEIERMWAWHRISRLEAEMNGTGDRDTAIAEIVRLGEAFSIVSKYTSFLVLENDGEYQRWKIERRNALRLQRDRQKQRTLTAQLNEMHRKTPAELGPINAQKVKAETNPSKLASLPQATNPASRPQRSRGTDLNFGGAVDLWSVLMAAGLALFAWLGVKR
jgi:Ca-activated chloride channel family protein